MNLITLLFVSILSENILLHKFLGICPFMGVSNKEKSALGMGVAVTFVIVCSSIITFFLNKYILIPTETLYLQTLMFILIISAFVQLVEIVLKKYSKTLYNLLGIYLPLITTNCAVLGVVLINIKSNYTFSESLIYALGSSIGFTLVIYLFSIMRTRIDKSPVIKSFKGYPIALIAAGIMALIFSRFVGV